MTKKFINALSKDSGAAARSRFLVPARDGSDQFEEIETGKQHDIGYLVYTDKDITVDEVSLKWSAKNSDLEVCRHLIESYLSQIANLRLETSSRSNILPEVA